MVPNLVVTLVVLRLRFLGQLKSAWIHAIHSILVQNASSLNREEKNPLLQSKCIKRLNPDGSNIRDIVHTIYEKKIHLILLPPILQVSPRLGTEHQDFSFISSRGDRDGYCSCTGSQFLGMGG